jgi:hypothetical protein
LVNAFGDKIRRFEENVSEMKRLAGHDLEDLLQVGDPDGAKDGKLIATSVHHSLYRRPVP